MFEFAIAQQQRRKPTRRLLACALLSVMVHAAAVSILVEYPQLLRVGSTWILRPLALEKPTDETDWRNVAFVGDKKMVTPPAEIIRKYAYNWKELQGKDEEPGAPPIHISLGPAPEPKKREKPIQQALGTEEPKPAPPSEAPPAAGRVAGANPPAGAGGAAKENKQTVYLPAPAPAAPRKIPNKVAEAPKTPTSIPPKPPVEKEPEKPQQAQEQQSQAKVFENEQAAIQREGTGFFDTKGFPLGEYANTIIERVKGNWMIPSNLRNSQGHTTIVFYIGKNGQFVDAHIAIPSGNSSLDLAALSAVIESNPFPPLPSGFPGERVGAKFVFSYNERP